MNNQIYVKEELWLMDCKPTVESKVHAMERVKIHPHA